jgi:hypothetical protein
MLISRSLQLQAIPVAILDSANLHSLRRRRRTMPTAINAIADAAVAWAMLAFVASGAVFVDIDDATAGCREYRGAPRSRCLALAWAAFAAFELFQLAVIVVG